MIKDLADDDTIVDEGDPPAPSAAVGAFEQSNSKDAFQQLGPRRALRVRLIRASGDAGRRTRDRPRLPRSVQPRSAAQPERVRTESEFLARRFSGCTGFGANNSSTSYY